MGLAATELLVIVLLTCVTSMCVLPRLKSVTRSRCRLTVTVVAVLTIVYLLSVSYDKYVANEIASKAKKARRLKEYISPRQLKLAIPGETTKVGETMEVYILSAFRRSYTARHEKTSYVNMPTRNYMSHNLPSSQTIVLVAWVTNRRGIDSQMELGLYVDMYPASFTCQLPAYLSVTSWDENGVWRPPRSTATVNYVSFAQGSCRANMTDTAHRIELPEEGKDKVAVCMGFMHGQPNLERLVEWLELARILGVSRVQIFPYGLSDAALQVLRHYNSTGLVLLRPVTIPHRPGEPQRDFTKNEPQKWHDKEVLLDDCMHRLSDYDFVIHQDLDELLLPAPRFTSLHDMLQTNVELQARGLAAFRINTFLSLSHWPETDPARPITFLRRLDRTESNRLDNRGWGRSSPKVIYRPDWVKQALGHDVSFHISEGSFTKDLPDDSYRFIHYRNCKPQLWNTCFFNRVYDQSILRFESQWLAALAKLPLAQLGLSEQYVSRILEAAGRNSTTTVKP